MTGANLVTAGRNFLDPGFLYLVLRVRRFWARRGRYRHYLAWTAGSLITWRRFPVFAPGLVSQSFPLDAFGLAAPPIYLLASDTNRTETKLRT